PYRTEESHYLEGLESLGSERGRVDPSVAESGSCCRPLRRARHHRDMEGSSQCPRRIVWPPSLNLRTSRSEAPPRCAWTDRVGSRWHLVGRSSLVPGRPS